MSDPVVLSELNSNGSVATITISRPQALNALNQSVFHELRAALLDLQRHTQSLRAVIITGAGNKAFVAGADIRALTTMNGREASEISALGHAVFQLIEDCAVPVIAAVNGFALGGGLELALACDLIYAADNAKMGLPEVTLGLIPGWGGTVRLARRVGLQMAAELLFTGEMISASQAQTLGLVGKVFAPELLMTEVRSIADKIASRGPLAVQTAKKALKNGMNSASIPSACAFEQLCFGSVFNTFDQKEGCNAFLEKRAPQFKGE